jgi:flagellar basal body rod protein FlgG
MSLRGIESTAQSLSYYQRLQEITAHNLANASTDAFKASRMAAHIMAGSDHAVPVESTDWSQGTLRETGRSLDVALEGSGFLVVQTPRGERLIRGGSLKLDGVGRIIDGEGHRLLGMDGPVAVTGTVLEIQEDGTVLVDGSHAGRLRLVTVEDPASLRKEKGRLIVSDGGTQPVPAGETRILQGRIEQSNIDPILSMVELIGIHRAYAANVTALRTMDGALGVATNDVGKV